MSIPIFTCSTTLSPFSQPFPLGLRVLLLGPCCPLNHKTSREKKSDVLRSKIRCVHILPSFNALFRVMRLSPLLVFLREKAIRRHKIRFSLTSKAPRVWYTRLPKMRHIMHVYRQQLECSIKCVCNPALCPSTHQSVSVVPLRVDFKLELAIHSAIFPIAAGGLYSGD